MLCRGWSGSLLTLQAFGHATVHSSTRWSDQTVTTAARGGTPRDGYNRRDRASTTLDDRSRKLLEAIGHERTVGRGDLLAAEGKPCPQIFIVMSGMVELAKALPDGRRQILGFRCPGEVVFLSRRGGPAGVTLQALAPSTVVQVSADALWRHISAHPEIGGRLLDLACQEIAAIQDHVLELGRKSAMERVASFFLELNRRAAGGAIELQVKRIDIADYLGLKTETVSRVLAQLKARKIVALPRRRRAVVLDLPALERLAQGGRAAVAPQ